MNNKKSTKRALLSSVLSLVLCLTMLIGTTFAWFTDSVTSSNNKIQSGTLKIDLELLDKKTGVWNSIKESKQAIFDYQLWEPGYTDVKILKVENEGTLALKWVAKFVSQKQLTKLAEVIDVYVNPSATALSYPTGRDLTGYTRVGTVAEFVNTISETTYGTLLAKNDGTTDEAYLGIALKMQESAGNDYQGLDLGGAFDIQIFATQLASEKDSFDENYDLGAYLPVVKSAEELASALEQGESVKLGADIVVPDGETLKVPEGKEVTLDLNGKTISAGYQANSTEKHTYAVENHGTLTLKNGDVKARGVANYGTLTVESGTYEAIDDNGGGAIWNYSGSDVTVNGGTFISADDAVAPGAVALNVAAGSTATINGGKFVGQADQTYAIISAGTLTINDIEVSSDHGVISSSGTTVLNGGTYTQNGNLPQTSSLLYITAGTTTVNGGTYNFNVEGKLDSGLPVYCAGGSVAITGGVFNGYVTEMISSWGGAGTATVTGGSFEKEPGFVAEGHVVVLRDGMYVVEREYIQVAAPSTDKATNGQALADAINATTESSFISLGEGEYKMPSITGSKEVTIVGTKDTVIDNTMGAYMDSSTVAFEGVTIKGSTGYANGNGSDYAALYTPNVTYTNCTFDGPFRIGRDGATFINCTFNNLGNDYVWTYGNDATFKGCTFNSDGKALLIYSDGGTEVSNVVVENCVFNATKGAKAGAIKNQDCAAIEIQNYGNGVNLVTKGNTIDSDFSGEWRIKAYHPGNPDVIVNGVTYTSLALDGKTMTIDANSNVTVNE